MNGVKVLQSLNGLNMPHSLSPLSHAPPSLSPLSHPTPSFPPLTGRVMYIAYLYM